MDALHWVYLIGCGVNIAIAGYNIFTLFRIRKMDKSTREGFAEIDRLLSDIQSLHDRAIGRDMAQQDDDRPTMH